jgi:hypothetical protein
MALTGRIDRIDFHERTSTWALLDYKICKDEKKCPENAHRNSAGWIDLQLPLYRHLAREVIGDSSPLMGYVRIADHPAATGLAKADWGEVDLVSADAAAFAVIRQVRAKVFCEAGDSPPLEGAFSFLFGDGFLQTANSDVEEDD